jgi:UDPglucose 6-dehydrogenase
MTEPAIGFAGLTHLGINSAVAAAERGFAVVGFDPDRSCVQKLAAGELRINEPGLLELLAKNASRLHFSSDVDALGRCGVVYIAPDVPTDDEGRSDLEGLRRLIATVAAALPPDTTMVILSQVSPGFTRALAHPAVKLYYQVETLIFGRAIERALNPERFIIGARDPDLPLPPALRQFLGAFGCPILPMRYESAELAKIAINLFLVSSVTTTNTLAELCEAIGADWTEIVPALRLDRRIGPHAYLAAGLGIAGGNLERDLATICRLADDHGTDARVVRAWIENSRHRRDWVLRQLYERVLSRQSAPVIGVLGLAYKEDTHSIKNSAAIALLEALAPFSLRVFDPVVRADPAYHPRMHAADSAIDVCRGVDALCVMTPWAEFRALDPAIIAQAMRGRDVIDPHRVLDKRRSVAAGLSYVTLGEGPVLPNSAVE